MKIYLGIIAGGIGTRLWPLSTQERPKQLLPFINNQCLLDITIKRLRAIPLKSQIFILSSQEISRKIKTMSHEKPDFFIDEPCPRNTAPAILYACHHIYQKDPKSLVAFFPADHYIPNTKAFVSTLQKALEVAQRNDSIAILGIQPTHPSTEYGYIEIHNQTLEQGNFFVKTFHEKPSHKKASEYTKQKNMYWNCGMFVAKTSVFLSKFAQHAHSLTSQMNDVIKDETHYKNLPAISIDYALMEKCHNAIMVSAQFEWHDVGNLTTFLKLQAKLNKKKTKITKLESSNILVHSNKHIICLGVNDLCIIETDHEIIIAKQFLEKKLKKFIPSYSIK
jgi:mannose-1-phosphate guanylyltransferase